jgi:hypothetical protein
MGIQKIYYPTTFVQRKLMMRLNKKLIILVFPAKK